MSRRFRWALAFVIVVAVLIGFATVASERADAKPPANPTPGCVDNHEFRVTGYPLTKFQVETAWGVHGQGVFISADGRYRQFAYYRCGHTDADLFDDRAYRVTVSYSQRTGANDYMEQW